MRPWHELNSRGKMLLCCVVLNIIVAITIANTGSWLCLVPAGTAMICGLSTYLPKYTNFQVVTNKDNERIKK